MNTTPVSTWYFLDHT